MPHELKTDEGLRAACLELGTYQTWDSEKTGWVQLLAGTIDWVRATDEAGRRTREFHERLWENNHVAALGQGSIPIGNVLDDQEFRNWLAARSMEPLPSSTEGRMAFLTALYDELKDRFTPRTRSTPHLKIFRAMAALYPEGMTTVASVGALTALTRAMGGRGLRPASQHVWVRDRFEAAIGPVSSDALSLAARIALPWMLYVQEVRHEDEPPTSGGDEAKLTPRPALRRRRGMTAIRGLFATAMLSLDFVRDGASRVDLLNFLRGQLPGLKDAALSTAINVLQGDLGVIRMGEGDRYVLTERGADVLESEDAGHLADWLLTRVLGPDRALVELRDRGPLSRQELTAAIRSMNPNWTTDQVPAAIISWLRSFKVIESVDQYKQALTAAGRQWAGRIHWTPEPLEDEEDELVSGPPVTTEAVDGSAEIPAFGGILAAVQRAGHFPAALVARLHAGLWSHHRRHFAILTGLSGSGKTLLAREYAKAITSSDHDAVFITAVQPGWYDPAALLGFVNPLQPNEYVRPAFLEFLMRAASNPARVHVAILDEMNLSHPEQYMAPLLSAMETGAPIRFHSEGDEFDGVPRAIPYPSNLVLIGTVNMDETTHGLSDKVLDRAFTLEFWEVDLAAYPSWGKRAIPAEREASVRQVLASLMQALVPARLHFGWRVVDDVLDFVERAATTDGALSFEAALDGVVYAKVLPKLRGEDSPRFREALARTTDALRAAGLEQSRAKVVELARDLEMTGSARFWR